MRGWGADTTEFRAEHAQLRGINEQLGVDHRRLDEQDNARWAAMHNCHNALREELEKGQRENQQMKTRIVVSNEKLTESAARLDDALKGL